MPIREPNPYDVAPSTPATQGSNGMHTRPLALRMARVVRHLDSVSKLATRLESIMNTVLLIKHPRWIDGCVLGLRGVQAGVDAADGRMHRELDRVGEPCWPCLPLYVAALRRYYCGTFFNYVSWYRLPSVRRGRDVDAVLSSRNSAVVWCGDDVDAVRNVTWATYDGVMDLRGGDGVELGAVAGTLLTGVTSPIATRLVSEFASGERCAALVLGPPGMGKSHVIEQVAAAEGTRRSALDSRPRRILRLPQAASLTTTVLRGMLAQLRPDVLIVHDVDTDAPSAATLLRVAESASDLGVALLCTANTVDDMHKAAFAEHRFGSPVVVDHAPEEVISKMLGPHAPAMRTDPAEWGGVCAMTLGAIAAMRRRLDAPYR